MDYKATRLWRSAFESQEADGAEEARARLREAYRGFRERAGVLAGEIAGSLPGFTVHDLTHLDALWETASLIAGQDVLLTPLEAFVLGGAMLLHDLGMSVAAYAGGLEELRATRDWQDAAAVLLRQKLDRFPSAEELRHLPQDVQEGATREALRLRHAEHAVRLATHSWKRTSGEHRYLIEDVELRTAMGELIGRVAHSHHWPVSKLPQEFPDSMGALSWCPGSWSVDPLKLACLLRLADASHLDARRAPDFLQALRQPQGISKDHWDFQGRLQKPRLEGERLVFTSSPFPVDSSAAWWLCLDALSMVDRELRQVDALLSDLGRPRFTARSVSGIEDPTRLMRLIRTDGWTPIDTRIRVGDIALLVERLGGEHLYGADCTVPLREMLQNATDAVRARRLLDGRPATWGDVTVRLGQDAEGHWVEVEDTGLGMSQAVLTGPLLELGTSYWSSPLAREECRGLMARGFQPTGRYGIGFFSVFMWGHHARVVTRRFEEGQRETRVLEFENGVRSRPLLRPAREEERMLDGGTRIRVLLKTPLYDPGGFLYVEDEGSSTSRTLTEDLRSMCPCPDVNLYAEEASAARELAVPALDWQGMDGVELLERISEGSVASLLTPEAVSQLGRNLRPLLGPTGHCFGRACISPYELPGTCGGRPLGLVTDGVFRGDSMSLIAGLLEGAPTDMSRRNAWPIVAPEVLAAWASEQGRLWCHERLSKPALNGVAQVVRACGGEVFGLPVALWADGWMTPEEIARLQWPSMLALMADKEGWRSLDEKQLQQRHRRLAAMLGTQRHVLLVNQDSVHVLEEHRQGEVRNTWPRLTADMAGISARYSEGWGSLYGVVVEAVARSWGVDVEDVLASAQPGSEGLGPLDDAGHPAVVLRNPKVHGSSGATRT